KANYEPNSVDENWPREADQDKGAFSSYPEPVEASKLRVRPESFADHFSQATLHYSSLKKHEQQHIKDAYAFELSKVQDEAIRQRVIDRVLINIDKDLATYVANELGLEPLMQPETDQQSQVKISEKLSIDAFKAPDIKQRKIAILVHNGANASSVDAVKAWAEGENAVAEVLAPSAAPVKSKDGKEIAVDGRQNGEPSVTYDAIVVIDGDNLDTFKADGVAKYYVLETYKHLKPIYLLDDKKSLLDYFGIHQDDAIFISESFKDQQDKFKLAIQNHRLWSREDVIASVPV
ncbi:catalase-related domain-containing protein, partial [uncultured Acinetobacter sp.]